MAVAGCIGRIGCELDASGSCWTWVGPKGAGARPATVLRLMRLLVARCSATYEGRLSSTLTSAVRLVMVKADGCVAIHADVGAYKPVNWMNAPNTVVEEPSRWVVTNPKGERLTIDFEEIYEDVTYEMSELTSTTSGRENLVALAAQAGAYYATLDLRFRHVDVQLARGGTGATVTSQAVLTAARSSGRAERDARRVTFRLSRDDGEWRVVSFRVTPEGDDG
jgi:ketosteroid isomerase-like protein